MPSMATLAGSSSRGKPHAVACTPHSAVINTCGLNIRAGPQADRQTDRQKEDMLGHLPHPPASASTAGIGMQAG